ncbi:MAG TPA: protein rhiA [Thermoanaerobaculia bacterium]|nr:protein rhiA [Thermoanaerobaculia bacterium]
MSNGSSGTTYSLVFQNNSINTWTAAVYQQAPNTGTQDVMSLAWFAEAAAPTTQVVFTWEIDYSFVWSQTGTLVPGVLFAASQTWATNPSGANNQVTFTDEPPFTFTNQTAGPQQGTLYINQDGTIPENTAAVGIAMSGAGTFVVQAEPNILASFTPTPNYWITFGQYTQGQVMDIQEITNSAQIVFPPNVYSMTAILNANNTWTVQTTEQTNAALVSARRKNRRALWGAAK